jgi:ankyrin repeat protein
MCNHIRIGFQSLEKSAIAYSKGWYSMQRAIVSGKIEYLKTLLQNGANPNLIVKGFPSPLNKAIIEDRVDVVAFLLENGANVNMEDGFNYTPIFQAIDKESIEILKI